MRYIFFGFLLLNANAVEIKKDPMYFEMTVKGTPLAVSAKDTAIHKDLENLKMVPRGSAVLTSSGDLANRDIQNIIHVAPGSMTKSGKDFDPSLEGLKTSLKNTFFLADRKKLNCVALPFIGGGIFLHSMKMTKEELAKTLVETVKAIKPSQKVTFVTYGEEDGRIFKDVFSKVGVENLFKLTSGSMTDFKVHSCNTIVNPANMEITFGGGLSGIIGKATGKSQEIDQQAKELITAFHSSLRSK